MGYDMVAKSTAGDGRDGQGILRGRWQRTMYLSPASRGQRTEVSGVSVDEEMINLIAHQQACAAAARLVTVADKLMQDLMRTV